jgi:two-component system, LuxR family, sensor kinase FixL
MKKMFLGIADAAPVGVLAICREGIIRFANPALCNIFGYIEAALIGLPVETLLPEAKRAGHRTHRDGFFVNPSARGMGEGQNLFGQHADGGRTAVEIGLGSIGQWEEALSVAFINDVSHKKLSEERSTTIVNALPAGLILTDPTGRILMTNPTLDEMFCYRSGELLMQQVERLLPPRIRSEHPALRAAYMRDPEKRNMGTGRDLLALHSSDREFPVEVALTPILVSEQRTTLAIVTDISVHKKLEQALVQANVNLEEFTYIASHDLRSPLRGIADLLEWIEEDLTPEAMSDVVVKNFAHYRSFRAAPIPILLRRFQLPRRLIATRNFQRNRARAASAPPHARKPPSAHS